MTTHHEQLKASHGLVVTDFSLYCFTPLTVSFITRLAPLAMPIIHHHFTPKPIAMGTSIAEQCAAGQPLGFPSASDVLSNSNLIPASDVRRHPSGASA